MRFAVWAPRAQRVDLVVADRRTAMAPSAGGWFEADAAAGAGTRYGFAVNGGAVRPDPRSARQPDGVHALSAVVDHGAFAWTDNGWRGLHLPSAVLYELHVGTFTPDGTFDGVITRLDHLIALGVTAVELMPVASFPGRHGWGYDGVDLFAVHEGYGGPDGLKRLVDACHGRGLGVVLDVVYNHLGPDGNYLPEFGPYFTDRYTTPWGSAVNFDGPGSDEVRRFVIDNALMWLRDYHVDGLRLDAVHAIFDGSPVHILEELATATGPDKPVVAESDRDHIRLIGHGLDAVWLDAFHHALHVALTGERNGYYADYRADDLHVVLRHEHPDKYVVFSQNHDQVGNRARGERLVQLVGFEAARRAAETVLRSPFIPLLFMGEEWGASAPFQYFADHQDPLLAQAISEGRRHEFAAFGWDPAGVPDPQDLATFERSKLDWSEVHHGDHAALLEVYRELIRTRQARSVGSLRRYR